MQDCDKYLFFLARPHDKEAVEAACAGKETLSITVAFLKICLVQTRSGNLLVLSNGLSCLLHFPCLRDSLWAYAAECSSGDPTRHAHVNLFQLLANAVIISFPWKTVG